MDIMETQTKLLPLIITTKSLIDLPFRLIEFETSARASLTGKFMNKLWPLLSTYRHRVTSRDGTWNNPEDQITGLANRISGREELLRQSRGTSALFMGPKCVGGGGGGKGGDWDEEEGE